MKKKRKNLQQISNRRKPFFAFLITLSIVLGVGLLAMLGYQLIAGDRKKDVVDDGKNGFHFFWENIPEDTQESMAGGKESRYGSVLADTEYMEENNIYAKANQKEGIVSLGFAGDILFDDEYAVMANLLRRGVTIENGISEAMLAQMQNVDIMTINNEFPYTDAGTRLEGKAYTFRADTDTVSYLEDMGVDLAMLANNHIYDFGEEGLFDTLTTLENAGIPYAGAGRNLEEAAAPVYFISGDIKIAFISATQIERLDNPDTRGATENSAGVFRCWNPEKLYEVVAQAKDNSDFVVVYIHWGTENVKDPDWAQLEQAPKIAEAGADLIIGDHPHCLQGIQYFGETPVIYSLGNFWFNSKTVDTCMVQVDISKDGIEAFRFIPAIQQDSRTDLAYGADKERIISYMRELSTGIQIDQEGYVTAK